MHSILATRYIYPLPSALTLLASRSIVLDNPRTDAEISAVSALLRETMGLSKLMEGDPERDWWLKQLTLFCERHHLPSPSSAPDLFNDIARHVVVVRFDDEGSLAALDAPSPDAAATDDRSLMLLEDSHPLVRNAKECEALCSVLSLLVHTEGKDYFGDTIHYESLWLDHPRSALEAIVAVNCFTQLADGGVTSAIPGTTAHEWTDFSQVRESLVRAGSAVDAAFSRGDSDKLIFIGELLVAARATRDARLRILTLTSILELLVARNPDSGRFNVEDSITKQFILKVGVLALLSPHSFLDNKVLRTQLKGIYARRSEIAHGSLSRPKPRIEDGEEIDPDEDTVSLLYFLVRIVVEHFVASPQLVAYLQEG